MTIRLTIPCQKALFGKHENILAAAARELKEETGLDAHSITMLHPGIYTSAGGTSEKLGFVLAIVDLSKAGGVHGLASEHEDLLTVVVQVRDFLDMARNGKLRNISALAAAQYLQQHRPQLRRQFSKAAAKKVKHQKLLKQLKP